MQAKARIQINLMLSKVDDIKQVAGIPEIVFPLFWFEAVSRIHFFFQFIFSFLLFLDDNEIDFLRVLTRFLKT